MSRLIASLLVVVVSLVLSTSPLAASVLPGQPSSPCFIGPNDTLAYTSDPDRPLDGRIGSTKVAFDALFEYKEAGPFDMWQVYTVPGCNPISVSLDPSDSYVTGLDLYPPRKDQGSDPRVGDPNDWTGPEAAVVAAGFVPEDGQLEAEYDQTGGSTPGYMRFDFSSDTLRDAVPESAWDYVDNSPEYGWFSVYFFFTDTTSIGWISIQLEIEDPPAPH